MIVYCCNDLIFSTKIRSTAQTLGVASRGTGSVESLRNLLDGVAPATAVGAASAGPTSATAGPAPAAASAPAPSASAPLPPPAALEKVTAVFVDLDLGEKALALIDAASAHPAKPRIIAFGAHVARELLEAAGKHGATDVMARGRFTMELPALLR